MLRVSSTLRVWSNVVRPSVGASTVQARQQSNIPAPADNRIEVFVDDIPVLVEPGSTVLQVFFMKLMS